MANGPAGLSRTMAARSSGWSSSQRRRASRSPWVLLAAPQAVIAGRASEVAVTRVPVGPGQCEVGVAYERRVCVGAEDDGADRCAKPGGEGHRLLRKAGVAGTDARSHGHGELWP